MKSLIDSKIKKLVENSIGKKIKKLRSDNGGEYINKYFTNFCARESIKREWTTPYNPEQKRVAEQKNGTIIEVAKAMLYDQDLPKFLWAEACNTTVYIQNRVPNRALGKVTPENVFTGSKPEVSHIIIFGSMTYYHVPDEKRKKLDQTAEKGFLMGYSENAKAYRIYIPESRKIVVRRDVKFLEERALRKSREMATETQIEEDPQVQPQRPRSYRG